MSSFGFLNSASYSLNFSLTSLKSDIPLPVSTSLTNFNEKNIITDASGLNPIYITLPAGNYVAVMTCAISNVTDATATVVKFVQMQLIDDTAIPTL